MKQSLILMISLVLTFGFLMSCGKSESAEGDKLIDEYEKFINDSKDIMKDPTTVDPAKMEAYTKRSQELMKKIEEFGPKFTKEQQERIQKIVEKAMQAAPAAPAAPAEPAPAPAPAEPAPAPAPAETPAK
jgi:hypothetical protein